MTWKKIKEKMFKGLFYVSITIDSLVVACIGANIGACSVAYVSNRLTDTDKKTVVITNGHSENIPNFKGDLNSYIAYFFMYAPVTLNENMRGYKTEWKVNTTKKETLDRLLKNDYKNLVLIGHGLRGEYAIRGGDIHYDDLSDLKIKGRLLKYTCGEKKGTDFADVILKNPENGFAYDRTISPLRILYDSWKKVFK